MLRVLSLAAATGAIFMSTPGRAQSQGDVRCLMLSNAFAKSLNASGSTNTEAQKAAQSAALFYLGKVDGRWSDAQLRATVTQQQKTISVANAGAGMQKCMQQMQASAKKMQEIRR